MNKQNQATKIHLKPHLFKVNKKVLLKIFGYLTLRDLSRLSSSWRRLRNIVQSHVKKLQVVVNDEHGMYDLDNLQPNHVILRHYNPERFFYKNPPFRMIKKLFLQFEDNDLCSSKINLIELKQLTHLKVRGPSIVLSSNKLPSVVDVDVAIITIHRCPRRWNTCLSNYCEKQVQKVNITLNLIMELLVFEKLIYSLEQFMINFEYEADNAKVFVLLKCDEENEEKTIPSVGTNLERRFSNAFHRLKVMQENHHNLKIDLKCFKLESN